MNNTVIEQHSVDVRSITSQEGDWLLNEKQRYEEAPREEVVLSRAEKNRGDDMNEVPSRAGSRDAHGQ